MEEPRKDDFVGRHLIVDASTYSRRNHLLRFQRSIPRACNFQVNARWDVIVDGRVVGDLDDVDFDAICGPAPTSSRPALPTRTPPAATPDGTRPKKRRAAARRGRP